MASCNPNDQSFQVVEKVMQTCYIYICRDWQALVPQYTSMTKNDKNVYVCITYICTHYITFHNIDIVYTYISIFWYVTSFKDDLIERSRLQSSGSNCQQSCYGWPCNEMATVRIRFNGVKCGDGWRNWGISKKNIMSWARGHWITYFGGIKQYKSMLIFRVFPLIVPWVGNDPCKL